MEHMEEKVTETVIEEIAPSPEGNVTSIAKTPKRLRTGKMLTVQGLRDKVRAIAEVESKDHGSRLASLLSDLKSYTFTVGRELFTGAAKVARAEKANSEVTRLNEGATIFAAMQFHPKGSDLFYGIGWTRALSVARDALKECKRTATGGVVMTQDEKTAKVKAAVQKEVGAMAMALLAGQVPDNISFDAWAEANAKAVGNAVVKASSIVTQTSAEKEAPDALIRIVNGLERMSEDLATLKKAPVYMQSNPTAEAMNQSIALYLPALIEWRNGLLNAREEVKIAKAQAKAVKRVA